MILPKFGTDQADKAGSVFASTHVICIIFVTSVTLSGNPLGEVAQMQFVTLIDCDTQPSPYSMLVILLMRRTCE